MATSPTPSPDQGQGAAPQGGGASASPQGGSPDQGQGQGGGDQATQLQQLLARWYQTAKQMAQSDPRLASGAEKISQGIQEMQTALVTPQQPQPQGQNPATS